MQLTGMHNHRCQGGSCQQVSTSTSAAACVVVLQRVEPRTCVTAMAIAAAAPAATAEPPLKPNQPTQSMPVPVTVMAKLWGSMLLLLRGPTCSSAAVAGMRVDLQLHPLWGFVPAKTILV